MSAKFLHAFSDEDPELHKQIGCMTGIFQIFDRQHILTARRINHKRLPSGRVLSASASLGAQHGESSPQIVLDKNQSLNENRRISMESSRASFSSSSGSSFSSLEYNKSAQQETLLFDRSIFAEKKLRAPVADGRPPRHEAAAVAAGAHRSLDFRDVVKDSINKDSRRDSPRPVLGCYAIGGNVKSGEPVDLSESLRVLVKLKEAPWSFSEFGESPRTSFEMKEVHRYSCDGREASRRSLDSRDDVKLPIKLRELPRLSLDSREDSFRNANSILKDMDSVLEPEVVTHRRSASVVAKLMGLEALPSLCVDARYPVNEHRPRPLKPSQDEKEDWISSPMRFIKDPVTPRRKYPDSKVRRVPKVPIETAPWKQHEKHHVRKDAKLTQKQQPESVYSEIERRLKELEFRQSNKDLRALKQILDAMQEKGLLETTESEKETTASERKQKITCLVSSPGRECRSPGTFESPIVIMKPASSVRRSGLLPSSVIPLEGLSGIQKLQNRAAMDNKKVSTKHRVAQEQTFNARLKVISDKKTSARIMDNAPHRVRSTATQVSSRPQQSERENSGSSLKTSGSLSPRLQQKRLEAEKSRPQPPSSDPNKPQRPSSSRKSLESVSPRSKLRQKQAQIQDGEQCCESSETRKFSCQSDEISQRSDGNLSLSSQLDVEVTSADRSADNSIFQQGSKSPSGRAARKTASVKKKKNPSVNLSGEVSTMECTVAASEQPSPVSVLQAPFYQDDLPSSPSKKILNGRKDGKNRTLDDFPARLFDATTNNSSSEINQKKLQSIENLVQKLSELSSADDGTPTKDHIGLLCETQSPDHRYVSEILLASGLLMKDLNVGPKGPMPIQLHPSGHPINPDLFLVLEQTKSSSANHNTLLPKTDHEKLHRNLVFDVVNELLIRKLELAPIPRYPFRCRKLACRYPTGQQLLKELCLEIEQFQSLAARDESSDIEINISDEDVLRRSESWADFDKEVPGVVLEIERLVFKDLIDEVVNAEAVSASQSKASRRRRQLFAK